MIPDEADLEHHEIDDRHIGNVGLRADGSFIAVALTFACLSDHRVLRSAADCHRISGGMIRSEGDGVSSVNAPRDRHSATAASLTRRYDAPAIGCVPGYWDCEGADARGGLLGWARVRRYLERASARCLVAGLARIGIAAVSIEEHRECDNDRSTSADGQRGHHDDVAEVGLPPGVLARQRSGGRARGDGAVGDVQTSWWDSCNAGFSGGDGLRLP